MVIPLSATIIKIQVCFIIKIIKKSNNQNPGLFDHLRSDNRGLPHRSLSRRSSRLRSGRSHFCKQVGNRQNGHFSIKVASVVFKTYLLTITIITWAIIITVLNIMITTMASMIFVIITINQDVRTHGVDHSNLCRLLNIW